MFKITSLVLSMILLFTSCQSNKPEKEMHKNPFFSRWNTPFGVPPFDQIELADYEPAFKAAIEAQNKEIDAIVKNTEAPNFENTIAALDKSGGDLRRVSGVFFNLTESNTNDELTAINAKISPLLANHQDNIMLNAHLFSRVKAVKEAQEHAASLHQEQKALLDEIYQGFVRGGAALNEEDQAILRVVNEKLATLYPKFGHILLQESNNYVMLIKNEKELAGLPNAVKDAAAITAKEKGHEGAWAFTLDKTSWIPFLQYADNRARREELYTAWMNRGTSPEYNTSPVIKEILINREKKARLLGYKNFAAYAIDENMAKTPENVYQLLMNVWKPSLAKAKEEAADLQAMMNKEGVKGELKSWDWWYYTEKLRKAKYDLDENELRPYFSLEQVRKGAFELAHRLYGLQFKKRNDLPVYHKDVDTYEILDADGSHIGIFYTDYFPRASKRGGAWMDSFRKQSGSGDHEVSPVIVNVCNFTKPTATTPSLLNIDEVQTLFHEFGHALHGFLSQVEYQSISGTAVKRDFVEMPSQVMENWAMEPEMLKLYAHHYKTGAVMPDELIAKIQKAGKFNQGFMTTEYLAASILDMDYHTAENAADIDLASFEKNSMNKIGLIDAIIPRYKTNYFSHIFNDEGYAAGYYVYIWAAVLDADIFSAFKEKGLFNADLGKSFREEVLSKGGSDDPMNLFVNFRGRKPIIEPLLKKRGLDK